MLEALDTSKHFLGLAPFLRLSLNGQDLRPIAQSLLSQANQDQENAITWMNLATVFMCLELREMGLSMQAQALALQKTYIRPANTTSPAFRLLMILAPGDLSENTPLDCLLEDSPVELIYHYADIDELLPASLPQHEAVFVALCDSPENRPLLQALEQKLQNHDKPVINPPQCLPRFNRDQLCRYLENAQGVSIPQTHALSRNALLALSAAPRSVAQAKLGHDYPLIVRPQGSHAGRKLARLDAPESLRGYLKDNPESEFYLAKFIDYRSQDGKFRKYRIALLDGKPYICHMAISDDWMVHYVNAGMYEDAGKRLEEGQFMAHFADFAQTHDAAFKAIHERLQMQYFCIDCAEMPDGQLLIFEIDHSMVVHAMDSETLFPFKKAQIAKLQHAFENFLYGLR